MFEAIFAKKSIDHITGDVHFTNLLLPKKNNILTIHDCGILKRTTGYRKAIVQFFWFRLPAKKSTIITVNSQFTKQDLLRYINYPEDKIIPIHIFVPSVHVRTERLFNKEKPTILQLGTAINKNLIRTAKALKGIPCKYIILGLLETEHIKVLQDNNIDYKNISSSISDEEVAQLYRDCDIVSFASTFEGFGMPIVEANATGRVVVTSKRASMPEVASNAAHLVNPYVIQDIRNGFLKVINDDVYRNQLIENGFENAKRFDKNEIAEKHYKLYRSLKESKQ